MICVSRGITFQTLTKGSPLMKKIAIILSILSATVIANAQSSCIGEAQIIAKVARLKGDTLTSCRAYVKDVTFYAASQVCPLDLSEVLANGIEIGLKDGHDCTTSSDTISGVLVQNQAGVISLEK